MREFMCIATLGYNSAWPQFQNSVAPDDACWGKIVNATGEHNVVYLNNKTACILNLPSDVRAGLISQLDDEFGESPIDCHVQFANDETEATITGYVALGLLFFSIFCLLATIFVYAVKKELGTVPGLNLLCLSLSHVVHYVTVVCNLLNVPAQTVSHWQCTLFGFTRHFTILATFYWLNVMAFDIWRTITSMASGTSNGKKILNWKRFVKYSVYAWGTPVFIGVAAVVVDNVDAIPQYMK
uniref:G-protein coupled receptors family 2 profile 2 domain-containing protein n=1 Tax=Strigamia maritima TaxID=126957 RepID=T1J8B0_STRMM